MSKLQNSSQRLADLRKRLGWSQEKLAERLGYARNYISIIERGEKEPGPRFLREIDKLEQSEGMLKSEHRHGEDDRRQRGSGGRIEESGIHAGGARGHLRQAREERGLSIAKLASLTKISAAHLTDLEQGRAPISQSVAQRLKDVLPALELDQIMGGSDSANIIDLSGRTGSVGSTPAITLPNGRVARFVPKLSYTQAGALHEWTDDLYAYEGVLAMDLPPKSRAFSVTIQGDSMEPHFFKGDDVIVLWGVEPRNGQVVVACLESGEVLCKLYSSHDRGRRVVLTSYNSGHHPPIEIQRDEMRWVYPVHSFNRQVM